ncbi:unnamed protein product [Coffea canephora]|uniref:RING-type E3 ubiquitin transferase n=2 Tax=Coffea TaxID=13442 RepID=A0A068UUL1_COFCA|nr:unnamed protein product [Coffea canephora]
MGFDPQSPSPSHFYSQELQLKLYQAFIFSIPILFSIILFLLFYLFYLKKRVSTISSPSANLTESSNQAALVHSSGTDVEILKEKLPVILFDEHSKAKERLCCVCLGEFEVKEELHQLPSCKHVFHTECIRHWLHSNSTCPLCRCSVVISTKNSNPEPPASGNNLPTPDAQNSNQSPRVFYAEQQEQLSIVVTDVEDFTGEHRIVPKEGSSGSSDSVCIDNEQTNLHAESVIIRVQGSNT